jgi:hypothetical protein
MDSYVGFRYMQVCCHVSAIAKLPKHVRRLIQTYLQQLIRPDCTCVIPSWPTEYSRPIAFRTSTNEWIPFNFDYEDRESIVRLLGPTNAVLLRLRIIADVGSSGPLACIKVPEPRVPRQRFSVCALPCGDIVICGGSALSRPYHVLASAEILDIKKMEWRAHVRGVINEGSLDSDMVALSDTKIMMCGGRDARYLKRETKLNHQCRIYPLPAAEPPLVGRKRKVIDMQPPPCTCETDPDLEWPDTIADHACVVRQDVVCVWGDRLRASLRETQASFIYGNEQPDLWQVPGFMGSDREVTMCLPLSDSTVMMCYNCHLERKACDIINVYTSMLVGTAPPIPCEIENAMSFPFIRLTPEQINPTT